MEQAVLVSISILNTVSKIMTFKDDWVTVPDDYERQLVILESRLKNYKEDVRIHNQPGDSPMMKILEKAEATLQRAESTINALDQFAGSDQCCSQIRLWCAKLQIVCFPENIGKILKNVNDDIDSILKVLKDDAAISTNMRDAARMRATQPSTRDSDHLYVPLVKTQSAVMNAIRSEDRHLVLLHGGVGKGKSTLAKFLARLYESKEMVNEDQTNRKLFDHVIWVSCTNCSRKNIPAKQFEILQDYSPSSLGLDSSSRDNSGPKRITEALQNFLRDRKVLIVLDDVSDPGFLYEMWNATLSRPKVKYLVTSQMEYVCSSLYHAEKIHMEDPTDNEAMRILASLVGLEVIQIT